MRAETVLGSVAHGDPVFATHTASWLKVTGIHSLVRKREFRFIAHAIVSLGATFWVLLRATFTLTGDDLKMVDWLR